MGAQFLQHHARLEASQVAPRPSVCFTAVRTVASASNWAGLLGSAVSADSHRSNGISVQWRITPSAPLAQRVAIASRAADSVSSRPSLLVRNGRGRRPVSWWALWPLGDPCGHPELSRRDADLALEVTRELALVGEARVRSHLRQGQVGFCLQKLLGPLDAAQDDVLVGWQPGGRLELPSEVVDAEAGDRRQLLQGRGRRRGCGSPGRRTVGASAAPGRGRTPRRRPARPVPPRYRRKGLLIGAGPQAHREVRLTR
jgi:hypothetical protein